MSLILKSILRIATEGKDFFENSGKLLDGVTNFMSSVENIIYEHLVHTKHLHMFILYGL